MKLGYNTNGLAHHDPLDALDLLADTGYQSVAITIDHTWLSPRSPYRNAQLAQIRNSLQKHQLSCVIESGARYLLNPRQKHYPTLMEPEPEQARARIDFLKYCIDTAVELGGSCVSIWSGVKPSRLTFQEALDRLVENLHPVVDYADQKGVDIGFEPEPGMLIDTTGRFERLLHLFDAPRFKMTMDLGHLFCLSEVPMVDFVERWADRIVNVHIEDMRAGVHEHLMFGEGQIYFPPVIESLVHVGYEGGLHVELSRHSHAAARVVGESFAFLKPILEDALSSQGF